MKGFKRLKCILASVLVAAFCFSTVIPAYSAQFSDVKEDSWYYNAVDYISDIGLMTGTSRNYFSPKSNVTRAMFAQILYNLSGRPSVDVYNPFDDVKDGFWYSTAVHWARNEGLISGYGDNKFGPDDFITREQMVLVLYNYSIKTNYYSHVNQLVAGDFTDYNTVSYWALDAIDWAIQNGLVSGSDGKLLPKNTATRAEIAQIMKNYCTSMVEGDFLEFDDISIPDTIIESTDPSPDGYSHLLSDDLLIRNQNTNKGYIALKYIGDTENKLTLEFSKNDMTTSYRMYAGKEYRYGYPYGAGKYHLKLRIALDKGYSTVTEFDINVSEEEYNKSLTAATSFYNYPTVSRVLYKVNELWDSNKSIDYNAHEIYYWMNEYLSYNHERANEVDWGYEPDFNLMFEGRNGICLDFASLFCSMLRAKGIPSRIMIGWVSKSDGSRGYHAWSQYMKEDGSWVSVDPTYGISATDQYNFVDLWDVAFNMEGSGRIDKYELDYIY